LSDIIDSIKPKWSAGHDNIPIKLIKHVKLAIIKPLLHVINTSIITGVYPSELKISKVIPVFKKGEHKDPLNYRPLAIQPSLSKILEKCMLSQLTKYFESNKLLDIEQHGYRAKRSTITALVDYIETILENLDEGNHSVGAFLDMTKAFDSVNHKILLHKLSNYGIEGKELNWLKSYLEGRKQYVSIKHINNGYLYNANSQTRCVNYSVPQGSVLGPFLFLCYLGGMPNHLYKCIEQSKLCIYADDISLIVSDKDSTSSKTKCNDSIDILKSYLNDRNLLLNSKKTKLIEFSYKNLELQQDSSNSNYEMETKFLGLILDNTLSWTSHVQQICKKISSGIFALKRLAPNCSSEILKSVYFAAIHSNISYGIEVYGGTCKYNLNKILVLQKKAIQCILNLKKDVSCKIHFTQLKIMTVYSLIFIFIKQLFL